MNKIILKYDFGDLVVPFIGDKIFRVVSIQVNMDKTVTYGCADDVGKWEWFKEYEIKAATKPKEIKGFILSKKNN
jgi:hypothetical protein